jgi:hypothetical protein
LEVPAGDETETFRGPGAALESMLSIVMRSVEVEVPNIVGPCGTVPTIPVDGENCTLVTPERLEPLMNRNGPVPACPLVGFRDVIWGAGDGVWIAKASASELEVPAGDETETLRDPAAALAAMVTVAVTCVGAAFTLLTVIPVDGENCTAVTPARLEPLITTATVFPACPLAGFRDVIWGAEAGGGVEGIVGTDVKVPYGLNRNPSPSSAPPEGFWN